LDFEDDDAGLDIPADVVTNDGFDPSLCLVGRFLTDRPIRAHII